MTVIVKGNLLDFQGFWNDKMSMGGQYFQIFLKHLCTFMFKNN